jgi:pyrroline-5-carboxylate reductase
MLISNQTNPGEPRIGILGCGHLGQAIALSLIRHGFHKENLFLSYRGNPQTRRKLEEAGLDSRIVESDDLFRQAEIIFLTVRPQDIAVPSFPKASGNSLPVSCMAGVSLRVLNRVLGAESCRMMPSGPDTLLSGQGVAAFYPKNERLERLLQSLEIRTLPASNEQDLNVFTAGVCLPAAMLIEEDREKSQKAIERIGTSFPLLPELYEWALDVLPHFDNSLEKDLYVNKMATKGGVTEAIVTSLKSGATLDAALMEGIRRSGEIAEETEKHFFSSTD